MNKLYRKTLIATAIAALMSAPAWSDSHLTDSDMDDDGMPESQSQDDGLQGDGLQEDSVQDNDTWDEDSQDDEFMDQDGTTDTQPNDDDASMEDDGEWESDSQDTDSAIDDEQTEDGAARARDSDNVLYSHTPDELIGMDVTGADGESIGEIKEIVLGNDGEDAYAVISSGSTMGIGGRDTVVSLDELNLVNEDRVESSLTEESIAALPEYQEDQYGVMESDRRISDFSANAPRTTGEQSGNDSIDDVQSDMASQAGMGSSAMDHHTPDDLEGMEVIGSDGESIGRIKTIVSSRDHDEVHAVIRSGGFLGLGSRDILVPLSELTEAGEDQLRVNFTQDTVESRPRYDSNDYEELEADRPIGDYSSMDR